MCYKSYKGGSGEILFLGVIEFLVNACKIISKRSLYHIVRVCNIDFENPPIELFPVVRKFVEVFHNDLPEIPPELEIDLCIDYLQETSPISIPPYRMAPTKLKVLKS